VEHYDDIIFSLLRRMKMRCQTMKLLTRCLLELKLSMRNFR